jgi:Protein of unknown function (DUF4199)
MQKIALELKWAVIFVVAGLVWMLLEKLSGLHSTRIEWHPVVTNFFIVVAVAVYWLALKEKRKSLGGTIAFKQAFISGLIISLIVTVLTPLWQYINLTIISPDYFKNVTAYSVENKLMTAEVAADYFSMKNYIIQSTIFAPVAGIITSLLVALIVSRKKAV